MGAKEDRAEDDRIDALKATIDTQAARLAAWKGTPLQKLQDRRVLNEMRQNEAQARLNRSLTRAAGDPLDIQGQKAAE